MRRRIILAATLAVAVVVLTHCRGSGGPEGAIAHLAPTAGEVEGWAPAGATQVFEDQDLFQLINGGAEIYHEFGFRRVLSQDYANAERRSITLEVFEMEDEAAAYGMYSFKSSGRGQPLELGDEAMIEDYYLNLRRSSFVVTLTAMNAGEDTAQGLVQIARAVAAKIEGDGGVPAIVAVLAAGEPTPQKLHYLRGGLALANVAPFTAGVRFGMTEGAAGRFSDHTALVLRYPDADRTRQQFAAVVGELGTRAGLTPVEEVVGDSVVLEDGEGTRVRLAPADDAIVMIVAEQGADTDDALGRLVSRVTDPRVLGERP
jgi:hypothetical protein